MHEHRAAARVALLQAVGPALGPDLISLVTTREEIQDLLALDDVIDLVIPRCVLCCAVLCCAVLCCAAPRCAALRPPARQSGRALQILRGFGTGVLCCAVLCCAVLC